MKTVNLATLSLLLISCSTQTSPKPIIDEQDESTLRHLKEVLWPQAYREQDTILLDQILGEDFQMIDQSGNWYTKKDELDWISQNATSYDSFYYEIKRLDIYDNGSAIVSGTGHIFNDTTESIYQSSNVLIKRNSQWKAVTSHVSGYKALD